MKFLCSNCKAKYQIADEKVVGRTLRMTCRRCQEEIVIRGEPPAPPAAGSAPFGRIGAPAPAPVPSPLGADFQMQVASNVRASSTPLPSPEEWHVAINDVPVGPIRREEIARKLAMGAIDMESLAWREGMDDWQPLREIPELSRLNIPSSAPPPLHPQPPPLAGRVPAAPYAADPWALPNERASQVMLNPVLDGAVGPPRSLPSWPVMFALAGGFAFLMSGLAIFGANWLKDSPQTQAGASAAGAAGSAAAAPQRTGPELELPEEEAEEGEAEAMIIDIEQATEAERNPSGSRPRANPAPQAKAPKGKQLTEAEKAMLARMGGDTNTNLSNLTAKSSGARRPAARGSLSAEAVSKVVMNGRKNLQRCYETAIRGASSDDTVRMDIELTVSPSGNVSKVKTRGSGPPGMAACIERTIKMWRFPQSDESSPVKFPLLFQPGA